MLKSFGYLLLAAIFFTLCLGLNERLSNPSMNGLVSTAEAIVGRPLTPVSVAGVARRTVRRCTVGIYSC